MKPRDLVLMIGGLSMAACLSILLLGGAPTEAAANARSEVPPTAEAVPAPDKPSETPVAVEAPFRRQDVVAATGDPFHSRDAVVDTSNWTTGVIVGDIQLVTSVLDKIQSIQIIVEELRNPMPNDSEPARPFRLVVPIELGKGTPTFRVENVPFSAYSYTVRVHSPALNGSKQTVSITKEHPYENGVKLAITPGVPYALLLRDQDMLPIPRTEVSMVAIGEPVGRPCYTKTTDNFGGIAHDYVLAGDYRVFVGPVSQPLTDPVEVTVQPAGWVFAGGKAQSQGTTITVPRGADVALLVSDAAGFRIPGASVRLQATDRVRMTEITGETDAAGAYRVPHLQAGVWQIDIAKQDYDRASRQITVKEGEPVPELRFQLQRVR